MVALGARSGYEIKRAADLSLRFFWALGPPQIYAELQRLENHGLLEGEDAARGGRRRRSYTVTKTGRQALKSWLANGAPPGALEMRDPQLLKLFFADALEPTDARQILNAISTRSQRAQEAFEHEILPAAESTADRGYTYPREIARFGAELHAFLESWAERLAESVAKP